MSELKTIRIYPELWNGKKYYYCRVKVYATRKQMQRDIKKDGFGCGGVDGVIGQCSGHQHMTPTKRGMRTTGCFATMWLNEESLKANGNEILSHECVHAAMRHVANKKVDLSNMAGEEALAYCQGSMLSQLVRRMIEIGVFNEVAR